MSTPNPAYCPGHEDGKLPGHSFVFLRQEKRNIGYDRAPSWLVEDVFYCSCCLTYRRVEVERLRG